MRVGVDGFNQIIYSNLLTAHSATREDNINVEIVREAETEQENDEIRPLENRNPDTCYTMCCCALGVAASVSALAWSIFSFWESITTDLKP